VIVQHNDTRTGQRKVKLLVERLERMMDEFHDKCSGLPSAVSFELKYQNTSVRS
jgi:hypothetical protein